VPSDWKADRVYFSARLGDSTNLWQAPISPQTWRLEGPATRLTFGTALELQPSRSAGADIILTSETRVSDIWSVPFSVSETQDIGAIRRVTDGPERDQLPSGSADGRRVAFCSSRPGKSRISIKDLRTGEERAIVETPFKVGEAVISPDGFSIAYNVVENDRLVVYVASGQGTPERVCEDCGNPTDWSSDGQLLLYYTSALHSERSSVGLLHIPSRQKMDLLTSTRVHVPGASFSRDGNWLAFHTYIDPLHRQIFVAPFRRGEACPEGQWIAITDGTALDRSPVWSPDDRMLFFLSERDGQRCIWARRLNPNSKRAAGEMFPVYHFHRARFSLFTIPFGNIGFKAAGDSMVFTLAESTGNIWLARQSQ